MAPPVDIVIVGERDVKRVLFRTKSSRSIAVSACCWIGVIVSTKVSLPFGIPRAGVIWSRIFGCGFLANPENSGRNILFPRICLLLEWVLKSSRGRKTLSCGDTGKYADKQDDNTGDSAIHDGNETDVVGERKCKIWNDQS